MNLKHLEYFVKVAEFGSISKAAQVFYLKPSNLSTCMKHLEEEFGIALFIRNTKGITLTANGKEVLVWAKMVLASHTVLMDRFAERKDIYKQTGGAISFFVGASVNRELYSHIFNTFSQQYPQIKLKVKETNVTNLIKAVQEVPQAIGITLFDKKVVHTLKENDELTYIDTMKSLRLAVFAAKNSVYAKEYSSISLKTLFTLPVIMYNPLLGVESPITEIMSGYGDLNIVNETSNNILFHSLLSSGQYVAIALDFPMGGMDDYKTIPIRDKLDIGVGMVYKTCERENPLIQMFINHAESNVLLQ